MSHIEDCVKHNKSINEEDNEEKEECLPSRLPEIYVEKMSQSGDIYVGSCRLGVPDGFGKYLWINGCMYEGDWICGKASGRGKMSWPSGITYDGEFLGGNMHGVGTFIGHNMTYKGSWVMNKEHGLGRKLYANGDVYEGLWKQGLRDGLGRYVWRNGNVYFGDWKKGSISGKGSLTWAGKESYDGQWQGGQQHGCGVYMWADGSSYIGTWSRGKKDGKGTFYPSGTRHLHNLGSGSSLLHTSESRDMIPFPVRQHPHRMKHHMPSMQNKFEKIMDTLRKSKSWTSWHTVENLDRSNSLFAKEIASTRVEAGTSASVYDHPERKPLPVLERGYAQGILISEFVKDCLKSTSVQNRIFQQSYPTGQSKRVGETIVKGHRSYDLMLNLQVGIRYSVGNRGLNVDLVPSDFNPKEKEQIYFPRKGSQKTPPHESVDFTWIDYCPSVFRKIREIFKIDEADYLMSLCGSDALRELSSPGKSGSVFYLSNDDRYMIKTLRKSEVKVLLNMLHNYYDHLCKYAETLITKFFALHEVMPATGKKIQVVVMGNIFCTELRIHRKFDLKGSLQGRSSKNIEMDETITLKDMDLDCDFILEPSWQLAFFKQVHTDCLFLESEHIMDYSLLLGVHFRAPKVSEFLVSTFAETNNVVEDSVQAMEEASPLGSLALAAHNEGSSVPNPHVRGSPLKVETNGHHEVDLIILGTNVRLPLQLGLNMPAMAVRRHQKAVAVDHTGGFNDEVHDVIIYFGIIDILQKYGLRKRAEHLYKALKYGSNSISAVNPHLYAQRLEEFVHRFFPPSL